MMASKVEDAGLLWEAGAALGGDMPLIPLVETALGVRLCRVSSVVGPAFGSVDPAAQLHVDHHSREVLRHACSELVIAAAAAGCGAPWAGPPPRSTARTPSTPTCGMR